MNPGAKTYAVILPGLLVVLLAGCPPAPVSSPPPGPSALSPPRKFQPPLVWSQSETRPLTAVTAFGGAIYAGTANGVLRFEGDTGEVSAITHIEGVPREDGLGIKRVPLGAVHRITGNVKTGLWIATDDLLVRYREGKFDRIEYHPLLGGKVTALLAEGDNIWVGASRSMAIYNGWWYGFLRGAQVTYLLEERVLGGVWVGTDGQGLYRYEGGKFTRHGPAEGQMVEQVRCVAYNDAWGLMAVGRGGGHEWLAFFDGKVWTSYRVEPGGRLAWVQQFGARTLISHGGRVMRLLRAAPRTRRPGVAERAEAPQGPVRLVGQLSPDAPAGYPMHHFYTERAGIWLPPDPTQVLGTGRETLFATRLMGVARFDGRKIRWYRTNDLLGDNGRLRMACASSGCYLPEGKGGALRAGGERMEPLKLSREAGATVQGFFSDGDGEVYGLHAPAAGRSLVVSRLEGATFREIYEAPISLPEGSKLEVRFCRADEAWHAWVGLWHLDRDGQRQHWGAVRLPRLPRGPLAPEEPVELPEWVKPEEARPAPVPFFRTSVLPGEQRPPGSLALPDDIRNVWFRGREVWLASGSGVLRVRGADVTTFTENEGLGSEITYAGLIGRDGVMVGSYMGVGRYDGVEWRFDLAEHLNLPSRSLLGLGPCLLVGSIRGVVQHCPGGHRFLDEKIGLVSNDVTDLYLDNMQRLWVLAGGGLSILEGFL